MRRISKGKFIASKFLQTTSRILFYVELLVVDNLTVPWNRSPENSDIEGLESYWFGLADFKSTNLSFNEIAPITGDNEMASHVMHYFLEKITAEATNDVLSAILPPQFLTAIIDGNKNKEKKCKTRLTAKCPLNESFGGLC